MVCRGPVASIRLSPLAAELYAEVLEGRDEISVKRKTHLLRYFKEFCENNPHRLSEEKFKKEGNFTGGVIGSVAVFTFKTWQWRLYGSILGVGGIRTFVGTRVDAQKKQDKANPTLLRLTASDIGGLAEFKRR